MTAHELDDLVDTVDQVDHQLHSAQRTARLPEADSTVILATVLDSLAPLVAAYRTLSELSAAAAPPLPWPSGTIVRTIRQHAACYGLVDETRSTTIRVRYADGLAIHAIADVTWVAAPCPTTQRLLNVS